MPGMWNKILENVGDYSALDKRLFRARKKVVGKATKSRNEFDYKSYFEDDSDVIVLDSNNLLTGNWTWRIK